LKKKDYRLFGPPLRNLDLIKRVGKKETEQVDQPANAQARFSDVIHFPLAGQFNLTRFGQTKMGLG